MRCQARSLIRAPLVDTARANLVEHSQVALAARSATQAALGQALTRTHSRDAILTPVAALLLAASPLRVLSLVHKSDHNTLLQSGSLSDCLGLLVQGLHSFVVAHLLWYGLFEQKRTDQVAPFALPVPVAGMLNGG